MAERVDALDQKAQIVASKIDGLAESVAKLEENRVQDVQKELLEQLYDIRQTLFEEFQSYQKNVASSGEPIKTGEQGGSTAELEALKKENARLKYRIQHMEKGLSQLLENEEAKALQKENARLQYRIKFLLKNIDEYEKYDYANIRNQIPK